MKIIGKWITGWEVRSSCTRLAVQTKNLQFKFNENTLTSGKTWNLIKKLVCNVVCHCGDRFLNALWKLFWHQEMQTNENSRYLISQRSTKKKKKWFNQWRYDQSPDITFPFCIFHMPKCFCSVTFLLIESDLAVLDYIGFSLVVSSDIFSIRQRKAFWQIQ